MNTLGIRVTPSEIYYSIYESEIKKIEIKVFKRAKYLEIPEYLKYIRYNLLDILSCKEIELVTIKKIEGNSININFERIYIEGVIQEALASSNVKKYFIENKTSFLKQAKKIKSETKDIKLILKNKENFNNFICDLVDLNTINGSNEEIREAILASVLAYNKGNLCQK